MTKANEIAEFVTRYGKFDFPKEHWEKYYGVMLRWGNVFILRNGKKIAFVGDYFLNDTLTKILANKETKAFGKFMVIGNVVLHPKFEGKEGRGLIYKALKVVLGQHPETEYVGWPNRKTGKPCLRRREHYFGGTNDTV